MTDKLYPDLSEDNNEAQDKIQILPYNKNISDQVNKNLSDARIKEIQVKRHKLEQNLKHYKKILKRWKKMGNVLKISSLVFLSVTTACATTLGAFAVPIVLEISGASGAVGSIEVIVSDIFILGLIKKKTTLFKKKIDYLQEYISKSWYLFEKIRDDNIITLDEVQEFRKLMDKYEKGASIEDDTMDKEYIKLRQSLKSQAEKEVKKEIKIDLKNEMKDELKQKYLQK